MQALQRRAPPRHGRRARIEASQPNPTGGPPGARLAILLKGSPARREPRAGRTLGRAGPHAWQNVMRYYGTRVDWRQSRMPAHGRAAFGRVRRAGETGRSRSSSGHPHGGPMLRRDSGNGLRGATTPDSRFDRGPLLAACAPVHRRPAHPSTGGPNILEARIFLQEWCELSSAPGIT